MTEPEVTATPKELLKRYYTLQEERVQTYLFFEEGYQAYLKGAPNYNFPLYRQLVHEITQGFKGLSEEIIDITEKFLQQHGLRAIASIINKIQDAEKKKIEMTVQLQIVGQKETDHPNDEGIKAEITDIKRQLKETLAEICDQMEELKYESEDLYDDTPEETESGMSVDR